MNVIQHWPNGWQCSCDNEFHSTITGASAARQAMCHEMIHIANGESTRIEDRRVISHK